MNCPYCEGLPKKHGKDRYGNQRYRCKECGKTYIDKERLAGKNLAADKIELVIKLLVEGNSIRATERISNVHRDTVLRLLETVGKRCMWIQEELVRGVKVSDIEADEIWGFVEMKQKTANNNGLGDEEKKGSVYTFTAIEANSKLIVAWHLGKRTEHHTYLFLEKIYHAVKDATTRFQMSTDAFKGYDHSVNEVLGAIADYGQIIKIYGKPNPDEIRYSASDVIEVKKRIISGNPTMETISTSYVERQNLTMRMSMRRLTRLSNGFSKKFENLEYALALHFAYYNFCRIHSSIRCTPAMEAGISKHVWDIKELVGIA